MKSCELCNFPARIYCESDQANLCCDCDSKVHSANFLVAKHSRTLLCHACQSPTPWNGSGPKLGPTVSVCQSCVNSCNTREERCKGESSDDDLDRDHDIDEDVDEDDDEDEDNDDDDDDDDEDEDNQVVPWSSTPPPPVSSSSTSEESYSRFCCSGEGVSESKTAFSLKRMRENAELSSLDDHDCPSSQQTHIQNASLSNESASLGFLRLQKDCKRTETTRPGSKALIDSLKRLQYKSTVAGDEKSTTILGICKLSKATGVGDGVT